MNEAEEAIRQASERTALVVRVYVTDGMGMPAWAAIYKGRAYDTVTEAGAMGVAAALMNGETGLLAAPGWFLA